MVVYLLNIMIVYNYHSLFYHAASSSDYIASKID